MVGSSDSVSFYVTLRLRSPRKPTENLISYHMKQTPFTARHIALGAKMAEFAGYNMPIVYSSIFMEHLSVRTDAGLFDVSHMGEFILKGPEALPLIQRLTSNDAAALTAGRAQYSCLTNESGGIVDDLLVYCLEAQKAYMLVVNAANIEKDWNWISDHNSGGAEMHDISERTCLLAVQGPRAARLLQRLTDIDLAQMKYYTFTKGSFAGVDNVLISATGYTGSGGVEIYFEDTGDHALRIWDAIFTETSQIGLVPAGLGARDTLRMEMGYCLYGNDLDDTTTPLEAGLGWITKLSKPFTGSPVLAAQKEAGVRRKLIGLEMTGRGIPRHGYPITDISGNLLGEVTSGTQSPSLGKGIGLGYIDTAYTRPGMQVYIGIRDKMIGAKIAKLPFQ